jgi:pyruvate dehydrogenase E1 component
MYRLPGARGETRDAKARLLGSGTILNEVIAAADLLEKEWNVAADVFSVTSFTELRREGMEKSRASRLTSRVSPSWIEAQLPRNGTPIVAATDYVSSVADLIRPWIADPYVALGTDGFGRSDTRANLRRFFEVDRFAVAHAALAALGDARAAEAAKKYGIDAASVPPWTR